MIAAKKGHFNICKLIIENVQNKNPANSIGHTPLHEAAYFGRFDICKLIIDNVDNKHPIDNLGKTPKNLADENNNTLVSLLFESN